MLRAPVYLILALLACCAASVAVGQDAPPRKVASIAFRSCPQCKLSHLPEVKKFLVEVVAAGLYPGVTVKFVPGALPEVFMLDADGGEIDKMYIEHLSFAELNTLVRSKGFRRKDEKDVARRLLGQGPRNLQSEEH